MPKISVIVPVYNVREYLKACVDSVRAQTLQDWELLLVNDGSTDGSGELCRALALPDERIRVLDQPNGGVSAARNTGLDASGGEYVTFLDGDDGLYPDHLETLCSLAARTGADVAASGMELVYDDSAKNRKLRLSPGLYGTIEEILQAYLLDPAQIYGGCNKLFRRDVIASARFSAYTRAEDALFCVEVLCRSRSYAVSDAVGYRYYRRADSVTQRAPEERSVDQVRAWTKIYELLAQYAPTLCPFAAQKICHDIDRFFQPAHPAGRELKRLREFYFPRQFPGGKLPAKKKIAAAVYHVSPGGYYWLNRHRPGNSGGDHE